MSYIGKILVVMQLVLSICLMAFAAAVSSFQTNWKAKTEAAEKQLKDQRDNFAKLEQESKIAADKFNVDLKAEQDKRVQAEAKVTQQNILLTNVTSDRDRLAAEAAQKTQINTDLVDDSTARQNEVKIVREKLKLALEDRDVQYKAKAALEDKIFELNTKIDRLTTQNTQLLVDNKNYRDVLNARGLPLEIEEYQKAKTPPPKVEGEVVDVRKPKEGSQLFEISVGENDGLSVGNVVLVYRSGEKGVKYLGKATIMIVNADSAVCAMAPRSNLVEKGDHVATKLN